LNVKESLSTCEPIPESKELQLKLEKKFETVMKNFSKRKADFEQLKNKPPAVKTDMYNAGTLQSLCKDWQKELELTQVEDEQATPEHTAQAMRDFMHDNEKTFKEIE